VGVWYVVLGAAITILPPGPLSPPEPYVWLRGLATVASGLAVFWLAPIDKRWLSLLGHLIVAAVQAAFAYQMINSGGALSTGLTLSVAAIGTASLPLFTLRMSRSVPGLPAYPLGVVAAAMGAVQGLAVVTGADRASAIVMAAGIDPQIFGTAMAIISGLAAAVCWTGFGGRRLVAALTIPTALFGLAIALSAGLFVSSSYWILNVTGYVRIAALLAAPWAPLVVIDWRSAFARTAITVTSTAIAPLMLVMTLVLYGPGWADSISLADRQLLFGLIVLLIVASVVGALFAARELTGGLFGLAQLLRHSSVEAIAQKDDSPITEVEILRRAVVELYDKLLVQNAELVRANASKDEFLGLVSHELKTPITTILAASALIRQRMGRGEEGLIEDLEAETERLASIVDNLLALARMDAGVNTATEPIMLNHLARDEVERAARRDTSREYTFATDGEAVVDAVGEQITMVLRNFIANASKYSPAGSAISVRVTTDGNDALLAVHDTGVVLQPHEVERLFEPFYRAESAGAHTTGVGIGLAVCKRVAESLGGTVEVMLDRAPNIAPGTEFRLRLPLATSDVEPAPALEQPVASASGI
jgi:signal transduction histidine kinase